MFFVETGPNPGPIHCGESAYNQPPRKSDPLCLLWKGEKPELERETTNDSLAQLAKNAAKSSRTAIEIHRFTSRMLAQPNRTVNRLKNAAFDVDKG
jgi:hypothetical protein